MKKHPADIDNEARIAAAVSFDVVLFLGAGRYTNLCADTIDGAREAAVALVRLHPTCTRRPVIYAITPDNRAAIVPLIKETTAMTKTAPKTATKSAPLTELNALFGATPKPAKAKAPKMSLADREKARLAEHTAGKPADAGTAFVADFDAAVDAAVKSGSYGNDPVKARKAATIAVEKAATAKLSGSDPLAPLTVVGTKTATIKADTAAKAAAKAAKIAEVNKIVKGHIKAIRAEEAKGKAPRAKSPVAPVDPTAMPTPPDFTAPTHTRYRAKLAILIALADAGDIAGLQAVEINPNSTSPKALDRYRNRAVAALKARAMKAVITPLT